MIRAKVKAKVANGLQLHQRILSQQRYFNVDLTKKAYGGLDTNRDFN